MAAGGLIAADLIGSIGNLAMGIWQNIQNQRNYEDYKQYNSPVQQMQRFEEAGLNPNLALGQPNTVTAPPLVSNPAESLVGLGSRIGQAYNTADLVANRKMTNQIRKENLELEKIKTDLKSRLVQQSLLEGNLDLALKVLNYDILSQTAPAEITKAFADAGLSSNKKAMSDIDLATYADYRDNIISKQTASINKTNAETNYLVNVKPDLEQYKAETARKSATWSHEDRQAQLDETKRFHNMSAAQQTREYNLAVRKYNLAVKHQDWEKAHYWSNVLIGAAAAGVKTAGRMYGIPIQ